MLFKLTTIVLFLHCCHIQAVLSGLSGLPESLRITLSLFSGRRNPKWSLPAKDPSYGKIVQLLNTAKKRHVAYSLAAMPARLGFRGFIVQELLMKTMVIVGRETTELQLQLLKTMPGGLIPRGNYQNVLQAISKGAVKAQAFGARGKRYTPPYDPAPWSANNFIQRCNNCYNYANIVMTNNTAEPGSGTGQAFQRCTPAEIESAATRDGLQRLNPQPGASDPVPGDPGGSRHLVALVVDPDRPLQGYQGDFHWYRLDDDGKWSHKPGETAVTRKDDANNEITDPRRASMAPYQFVSFMTSDRNAVQIQDSYVCN